jgi:tRNA threonylcarbamoyladenosine biosynthesis protein TsaB
MAELAGPISVAIETTCRLGGLALGAADAVVAVQPFDASRRAATQVVGHLDNLLRNHDLTVSRVDHLYVATGPGSYTGTRVGVTVARTLAQAAAGIRCVAVPTPLAVAEAVRPMSEVRHLGVVLDARKGRIFAALFERDQSGWRSVSGGELTTPGEFLASAPRPLHLTGEGLAYHAMEAADVVILAEEHWLPRVENVWHVGHRLAAAGRFTEYHALLPVYTGEPEAVRLWEQSTRGR